MIINEEVGRREEDWLAWGSWVLRGSGKEPLCPMNEVTKWEKRPEKAQNAQISLSFFFSFGCNLVDY